MHVYIPTHRHGHILKNKINLKKYIEKRILKLEQCLVAYEQNPEKQREGFNITKNRVHGNVLI